MGHGSMGKLLDPGSNPVAPEPREGRVNRYKGHVIRRNLAKRYGLSAVARPGWADRPWEHLFQRACSDHSANADDLRPESPSPGQPRATYRQLIPGSHQSWHR